MLACSISRFLAFAQCLLQECKCQSQLPPGCDCDPESPTPDSLCPADLRCVGCKCQNCPSSGGQGLGQGRGAGKVLNPPLVFVIDTTKSVKPDKDSIFNLTSKVTARIMKDRINIPRQDIQEQISIFNLVLGSSFSRSTTMAERSIVM